MLAAGVSRPTQVRATGGGIASPVWRQILADVLEVEIATVTTTEGAAFGAALLAMVGAGKQSSVAEAAAAVRAQPAAEPGVDAEQYAERHALYRELYPALQTTFRRM
jgi:xylulokinase